MSSQILSPIAKTESPDFFSVPNYIHLVTLKSPKMDDEVLLKVETITNTFVEVWEETERLKAASYDAGKDLFSYQIWGAIEVELPIS